VRDALTHPEKGSDVHLPRTCDSFVPLLAFPERLAYDMLRCMKVATWLHRLLPILAIVGLVAGSFTAPVNGAAMAAAVDMSMPEMADDMPCCPHETPAIPDCQKTCPLMALCMAKCFSVAPMLSRLAFVLRAEGDALRPGSDVMGDALAIEPPARPPRT
jgi:hypothetical protein